MSLRATVVVISAFVSLSAAAETPSVKIGVLTDMSSSYADYGGAGSVIAAKMAIADSGMPDKVQIVSADTLNKPDNASALAHQWFSEGVSAIFDVPTSGVALAVNAEAGRSHKLVFFSTTINDRITEEDCNGYGLAWVWDTYSVGRAEATSLLKDGRDTWFLVTPDGAAGTALEQTARQAAADHGGRVLGAIHHPVGVADWSSYLLQAQASGAKAILFGSGGSDLVSGLQQAREFGLPQSGITIGTMYAVITDVDSLGLQVMQGLDIVTAFYWDRDEETRKFSKRFIALHGKMPTMFQAGVYSAVLEYLRAVQATGTTDADRVREFMLRTPMQDVFLRNGKLLPNGRMLTDMLLARIKAPSESHYPWDYYRIAGVVPGEQAFRKLADSKCPLRR